MIRWLLLSSLVVLPACTTLSATAADVPTRVQNARIVPVFPVYYVPFAVPPPPLPEIPAVTPITPPTRMYTEHYRYGLLGRRGHTIQYYEFHPR